MNHGQYYAPRPGGPSRGSLHSSSSNGLADREAEKKMARLKREQQSVVKKHEPAPTFTISKTNAVAEDISVKLQDQLGDYYHFAGHKRGASSEILGVEAAPATPAPPPVNHDQDRPPPTRPKPLPPAVAPSLYPGPFVPPPGASNFDQDSKSSWSSSSRPVAGNSRYSKSSKMAGKNYFTGPTNPHNAVEKLSPSQVLAAQAKASAHMASVGGKSSSSRQRPSPATPMKNSNKEPPESPLLSSPKHTVAAIVSLTSKINCLIEPLIDSSPRSTKAGGSQAVVTNKGHRRVLLDTPALQPPAPHVPPPPPPQPLQQSPYRLSPASGEGGEAQDVMNSTLEKMKLFGNLSLNLSEDSEGDRDPPARRAPAGHSQLAAPPPAEPEEDSHEKLSNSALLADLEISASGEDSTLDTSCNSRSASDSTDTSSEESSSSSEDEDEPQKEEDVSEAEGSRNVAEAPPNAHDGSRNNVAPAPSYELDRPSDSNKTKDWSLRSLFQADVKPSDSNTQAPHAAASARATSPILSDDSSDDQTRTPRPALQVTAVVRSADRPQRSLSSDSDSEPEAPPPPPSRPETNRKDKRAVAASARSVLALNKQPKTLNKTKQGRGRPRKSPATLSKAEKMLEVNAKSRKYISTDDDTDSEEEKQKKRSPIKVAHKEPVSRKKDAIVKGTESAASAKRRSKSPASSSVTPAQARSKNIPKEIKSRDHDGPPAKRRKYSDEMGSRGFSFPLGFLKKKVTESTKNNKTSPKTADTANTDVNKKRVIATVFFGEKNAKVHKNTEKNDSRKPVKKILDEQSSKATARTASSPAHSRKRSLSPIAIEEKSAKCLPVSRQKRESPSHPTKEQKSSASKRLKRSTMSHERGQSKGSTSQRSASRSRSSTPVSTSESPARSAATTESRVPDVGESPIAFQSRRDLVVPSGRRSGTPTSRHRQPVLDLPQPPSSDCPPDSYSYCPSASPHKPFSFLADLEGQDLEKIFVALFDNISLEKRKDHMFLSDRAKQLKRNADTMNSVPSQIGVNQLIQYMEAVIYFILSAGALEYEAETYYSAATMYSETNALLKWVSLSFTRRNMPQMDFSVEVDLNCKLTALSLLCQSILSLKVYNMRKYEVKDSKHIVYDYFTRISKDKQLLSGTTPSNTNHGSSGGAMNPSAVQSGQPGSSGPCGSSSAGGSGGVPTTSTTTTTSCGTDTNAASNRVNASPSSNICSTPSPTSSLNSECSSGYLTSSNDVVRATNTATPSPSQPPASAGPAVVEVPADVYAHLTKHFNVYHYLQAGHEMWLDASLLIDKNALRPFFDCLDRAMGKLTMESSTQQLVCYMIAGLREVDLALKRYMANGGGRTDCPPLRQPDQPQ